jgi:hypothetical protein
MAIRNLTPKPIPGRVYEINRGACKGLSQGLLLYFAAECSPRASQNRISQDLQCPHTQRAGAKHRRPVTFRLHGGLVVAAAAQKRGPHPQRTLHSSLISVQYFRNIYKSFGKLFWANFLFSAVLKKSFKRLQKGQKNLPKTGKNWRNKNPVQFLLSVQS